MRSGFDSRHPDKDQCNDKVMSVARGARESKAGASRAKYGETARWGRGNFRATARKLSVTDSRHPDKFLEGLWSSGTTRHSHCRDPSPILGRSTLYEIIGKNNA